MPDGKSARKGHYSKEQLMSMFRNSAHNKGKTTLRRAVLGEVHLLPVCHYLFMMYVTLHN